MNDIFEICSMYEINRQNDILKKENKELIERLNIEIENHINSDLNYIKIIKELHQRIDKARNKINNMFDNGNENTIIKDLLELDRILGDDNA